MKKKDLLRNLALLLCQALFLSAAALFALHTRLQSDLSHAFLFTALAAPLLAYSLLFPFRRLRWLYYPLAFLSILAAALSAWPTLRPLLLKPDLLPDLPAALSSLSRPLFFAVSVLVSSTAFSIGEISCLPLGIAVAFFSALLAPPSAPRDLLLPGAALALSACPPGRAAFRAMPAVLLSLALALLLALGPLSSYESPVLRERSVQVFEGLRDRLFYSEARMPFTLASLGWQPLGAGRPGGSAFPSDVPVLEVRASTSLLLRGAVHSEYDGHAFSDPVPGSRYLLTDPRYRRLRDALFDRDLPKGALRAALPPGKNVSVRVLYDAAGTLFVTGRFDGIAGSGLVLYHSGTGEIFATRNLRTGDTYTFSGIPLSGRDPAVQALAAAAERQAGDTPDLSAFLALPTAVEPAVFLLAEAAAGDAESAAEKAENLASWLSSSYPYSLQQNTPPADRDFVSWFLLSERRGYCTSFAAALVVLARCAGLPARYCEGFSARPGPDGVALLTGWDAHAWAEIYLPGLGWTPYDATPAIRSRDSASLSPAPGPAPVDTASPQRDSGGDDVPAQTAPAEPSAESGLNPGVTGESPGASGGFGFQKALPRVLHFLLFALSVFLFPSAALLAALLLIASPRRRAKNAPPRRAVRIWYDECSALLTAYGLPPLSGEAPGTYLRRAEAALPGLGLSELAERVSRCFYAKGGAKPEDAAAVRHVCGRLRRRIPRRATLRAAFLRARGAFRR